MALLARPDIQFALENLSKSVRCITVLGELVTVTVYHRDLIIKPTSTLTSDAFKEQVRTPFRADKVAQCAYLTALCKSAGLPVDDVELKHLGSEKHPALGLRLDMEVYAATTGLNAMLDTFVDTLPARLAGAVGA
jgi:hypothetical protein